VPSAFLMGMRVRIDSRMLKSSGSETMGSARGRKPLVVETMNAGRVVSRGLVSPKTSKDKAGVIEPILIKCCPGLRDFTKVWEI